MVDALLFMFGVLVFVAATQRCPMIAWLWWPGGSHSRVLWDSGDQRDGTSLWHTADRRLRQSSPLPRPPPPRLSVTQLWPKEQV